MNIMSLLWRGLRLFAIGTFVVLLSSVKTAAATALSNPVLFVTQVPLPKELNGNVSNTALSVVSLFGNATADTAAAGRGGDLMLMLPSGGLVNLTRGAGYGVTGIQHTNGIAVRDPHVHWSGTKALFSMVVGAPKTASDTTKFFWQIYEIANLSAIIGNTNTSTSIVLMANQPANYNNVSPCYGTDDRIIFTSDRPINGQSYLYPPLDEYKGHASVNATYSLDRQTGDLKVLQHVPSGAFNPFIDSFGRLIVTRWDHLVQDANSTDDRLGRATNGAFNFSAESPVAGILPAGIENFPEPRNYDTNQINLLGVRGNSFNQFLPWMLSEQGGGEELINHWGRQEFNLSVPASFPADATLLSITNVASRFSSGVNTLNSNYIGNFLQIAEDPMNPGTYFGIDAPDFSPFGGTHSAGQIVSITGGPSLNPTQMVVNYITPKSTAGPNSFGIYRNPLPLANGNLLAVFTPANTWDTNTGSATFPTSLYQFRLVSMKNSSGSWTTNQLLTGGIPNTSRYYDGSTLVTHSGNFWELQPVEVKARVRPQPWVPAVASVEQAVFSEEGVDLPTFQTDLQTRGMALVVSRNVTARDSADKQQPFNLRIPGGAQTITSNGGKTYDITHLQFLQADYLRGYTLGTATAIPGRRVLATPMHDLEAYNLASSKPSAPLGGTELMSDGSQATFVHAGRATTWQLTGTTNESIVKERYWVTFKPGEVRTCANCHGINSQDQVGRSSPTNAPLALRQLLRQWRTNSANAYTLTVNSGSGSGKFGAGSILTLAAQAPAVGTAFAGWSGPGISSPSSPTTQFIMPATDTIVAATYTNLPPPVFNLTVVGGTGGGSYAQGSTISISAGVPPVGQLFDQWTGASVANPFASTTTLVMPGNATTVTAQYKSAPPPTFALTVNNGTGNGQYMAGMVVTITANPPPAGLVFANWTGATVTDANATTTTLTMPAAATTVTAQYKPSPAPTYALTVNGGTGSGQYSVGTVVVIMANAAPAGQVFANWTGTSVANANSASTTLTMPANATTVTANYQPAPPAFNLTVVNGTGSGAYLPGTVVSIAANAPTANQEFDQWINASVANSSAPSTTLTMPSADTTVTATFEITGVLTNQPPVAFPQSLNVIVGTPTAVKLAGSDPDGDELVFATSSEPKYGSLIGTAPDLVYTPNANFLGADSFTFIAMDGFLASAPATVSLNVVPPEALNIVPTVALTSPTDNATSVVGTPISITANAADADGNIVKVGFYANGFKIGESVSAPYTYVWNNPATGVYVLTAKAYDDTGARTYSAPVRITVTAP